MVDGAYGNEFIALGEDEDFICYRCGKDARIGFLCKYKGAICPECQEEMNKSGNREMYYCTLREKGGQYQHTKYTRSRKKDDDNKKEG